MRARAFTLGLISAAAAERELPVYLALGVTGVRNMHTSAESALELTRAVKRRIADGTLAGPRFIANGPIIDGPVPVIPRLRRGGHAGGRSRRCRLAGRRRGGLHQGIRPAAGGTRYFAVAEQAKRHRVPFVGHLPAAVRAAEAAEAGQRSIEHAGTMNIECSTRGDSIRSGFLDRSAIELRGLRPPAGCPCGERGT